MFLCCAQTKRRCTLLWHDWTSTRNNTAIALPIKMSILHFYYVHLTVERKQRMRFRVIAPLPITSPVVIMLCSLPIPQYASDRVVYRHCGWWAEEEALGGPGRQRKGEKGTVLEVPRKGRTSSYQSTTRMNLYLNVLLQAPSHGH